MKKPDKVNLLKDVFENQDNIIQVVKSVDKDEKYGFQRRLHNLLFLINNKNKRTRASVEDIATVLVSPFFEYNQTTSRPTL